MKLAWILFSYLGGCLLSLAAAAAQFPVPGLGAVTLDVPAGWRVQDKPGPISVYLQIRPESGDVFYLQTTSFWLPKDKLAELPASIEGRVEAMLKRSLPGAVDTDATLVELKGKEVSGYYYALTSRGTPQGTEEYPYVIQGMFSSSTGFTLFTLLYRDPELPDKQKLLDLLAGATFSRDAVAALPLARDSIRVEGSPQRYELWVPASRLYLTVPRARLAPATNPFGGGGANPRYFYFTDRAFNVSGWFEPSEKFSDIRQMWERDTRAWKEKGLPAAMDVSFKKVGGWDVVVYDQPVPGGTNSHIRAHWVQSGTWIDVHLSLTSTAPSEKLRAALEAFLQGMFVHER
jgi:hypothetical protein